MLASFFVMLVIFPMYYLNQIDLKSAVQEFQVRVGGHVLAKIAGYTLKSVTNILNRSPTSQTCHQRIWSLTSVTNINVTILTDWIIFRYSADLTDIPFPSIDELLEFRYKFPRVLATNPGKLG